MNLEMPLVSVVIPIYNVETYLHQCLDSVVNQTFGNLEIILVDDGSIDGCGAICDEYAGKDSRFRVLHTDNRGLASARNTGLEAATGEYIFYIDSDDWIEPVTIESLLSTAEDYDADIVAAGRSVEYVGRTVHAKLDEGVQVFRGSEIIPAYMNGATGGDVAWNKLYRASCFGDSRYPDGHNHEDVGTTWKIIKRLSENEGTVAFLPEELYHLRRRASSITHTRTISNAIDAWDAFFGKYLAFPNYQDRLIDGCFHAIGKMWGNYAGLLEEDREQGADTVLEMYRFSKTHFHQVIRGKYSFRIKIICLCSQTKSPAMMWMYCNGNKMRRYIINLVCRQFE